MDDLFEKLANATKPCTIHGVGKRKTNEMKWKDASKELPPQISDGWFDSKNVIALCNGSDPVIAYYSHSYKQWEYGGSAYASNEDYSGVVICGKITHWIEIPELPK